MKTMKFIFILICTFMCLCCEKNYEYNNINQEINYTKNCSCETHNQLLGEWKISGGYKKKVFTIDPLLNDTVLNNISSGSIDQFYIIFRNCNTFQTRDITSGSYTYTPSGVFHDTIKLQELNNPTFYPPFRLSSSNIIGKAKPWLYIKDIGELSMILFSNETIGNQYIVYEYFLSRKL